MKTILVVSALASIAVAAPALEEVRRQKKSPTLGSLLGHAENVVSSTLGGGVGQVQVVPVPVPVHSDFQSGFHHPLGRTFLKKKPIIVVKRPIGYSVYRDSAEEAQADPQVSCSRQVNIKLCDGNTEEKSVGAENIQSHISEQDMEHSIKLAKEAMDNLQQNLDDMERNSQQAWKHGDAGSDTELHQNIEKAKVALGNIENNFGKLESMNLRSTTIEDIKEEDKPMPKTEQERLALWQETIENINRNVELARNLEDSFKTKADDLHKIDQTSGLVAKQNEETFKKADWNHDDEKAAEHKDDITDMKSAASEISEMKSQKTVTTKVTRSNTDINDDVHVDTTNLMKTAQNLGETESVTVEKTDETDVFKSAEHSTSSVQMKEEKTKSMSLKNSETQESSMKTADASLNEKNLKESVDHDSHAAKNANTMNEHETIVEKITEEKKEVVENKERDSELSTQKEVSKLTKAKEIKLKTSGKTTEDQEIDTTVTQSMKSSEHNEDASMKSSSGLVSDSIGSVPRGHLAGMQFVEKSTDGLPAVNKDDTRSHVVEMKSSELVPSHISTISQGQLAPLDSVMHTGLNLGRHPTINHLHPMHNGMHGLQPHHPHSMHRSAYGYDGPSGSSGAAASSGYGSGSAVGVFQNANVGNCAVPLLLSCSPSVVTGSLKAPAYSAPSYRSNDVSSGVNTHTKRDTIKVNSNLKLKPKVKKLY